MSEQQSKGTIDPLHRIIIPIEKRMTNGDLTFRTQDGERYIRSTSGVIRRKVPKINGKVAKRERQ